MIYIVPKIDDRPIKIVCDDAKVEFENGDMVITKKLTLPEIAELFDVTVDDILSGMKFGIYTVEGDCDEEV